MWSITLMLKQRVDVAPLFLSRGQSTLNNCLVAGLLVLLCCYPQFASAQNNHLSSTNAYGYVAKILSDSPQEVADALARAEKLYADGRLPSGANPISIILHGPEVEIFFKDNYDEYKKIVDLAARLSAFGVVDVRVCETQSGIMGRSRSSIHSFIGTVPFGPTEVQRLLDQKNYVYF